jgi:hypothetical protein
MGVSAGARSIGIHAVEERKMPEVVANSEPPPGSMPEVSPALFVDAVLAFQKTACVRAAVELDLFTTIAAGAPTANAIAKKTGASARGIRILCDFLTVNGFLTKSGDAYALTPSSQAFLDRRSPAYMGSIVRFLAGPENIGLILDDPSAYVRNGGSVGLANMAPDNPVWVKFAEAMVPFMAPIAEGVAAHVASWPDPPGKVLDIAAGHGLFGIAVGKAVPGAEIVAVDWQSVLSVALRNAAQANIAARYRTIAGSAFDVDWGTGYDLVLLPNFLHHFDKETCASLLRKVRASLAGDGRALAIEFVPNPDRISPPLPATFACLMLATTPKGDAYTEEDFAFIARAAGYSGVTVTPLPPSPQSLVSFN